MTGSPVSQFRRLRAALKQEREAQGLTQGAVAEALEWSPSKIIRIEKGSVGISITDLKALLLQYGVTDPARVNEMVELARASKKPAWWHQYRNVYSQQFLNFLGLEAASIRIRQFQGLIVPGLLQTPEYARALFTSDTSDAMDIEERVKVRLARQQIRTPDGPEMFFVLDEAVLHRQIGDSAVMDGQMRKLVELAAMPNVTIQVMPFVAGFHDGLRSSFEIFELSDEDNDYAMILEQSYEDRLIDEPSEETNEYVRIFMELEKVAYSPADSVKLIERVLSRTGAVT